MPPQTSEVCVLKKGIRVGVHCSFLTENVSCRWGGPHRRAKSSLGGVGGGGVGVWRGRAGGRLSQNIAEVSAYPGRDIRRRRTDRQTQTGVHLSSLVLWSCPGWRLHVVVLVLVLGGAGLLGCAGRRRLQLGLLSSLLHLEPLLLRQLRLLLPCFCKQFLLLT